MNTRLTRSVGPRRMVFAIALLALALGGLAPVAAQDATAADLSGVAPLPLTGDRLAEFEAYVAATLAMMGVPGAAVAVVQGGEVVYLDGFGVKELGGTDPVTPDTLMRVASVTKPVTTHAGGDARRRRPRRLGHAGRRAAARLRPRRPRR